MNEFTVRPATPDDLTGIHQIYNDAVLHTTATYDYEPRGYEYRQRWFAAHTEDRLPVLVAVDGAGRVFGWSALNKYHDRAGYRFTAENSVYVADGQRGRGIGKRLLAPLIEAGRGRGLHAIIAAIDAENAASVRLHAAFGFQQVGLFQQVGYKFDRWLDVLYMELLL